MSGSGGNRTQNTFLPVKSRVLAIELHSLVYICIFYTKLTTVASPRQAVRVGFEPTVRYFTHATFPRWFFRPLRHLTGLTGGRGRTRTYSDRCGLSYLFLTASPIDLSYRVYAVLPNKRKVEESNPCAFTPHRVQTGLPTIQRYLPCVDRGKPNPSTLFFTVCLISPTGRKRIRKDLNLRGLLYPHSLAVRPVYLTPARIHVSVIVWLPVTPYPSTITQAFSA